MRYTPIAMMYAIKTYIFVTKQSMEENEMSRLLHAQLVFSYKRRLQHHYTTKEIFEKLKMRKRIKDKDLIRMKEIIEREIARRTSADNINTFKGGQSG